MVDRADIDALLISALYGELTPADEARLTLHLDTHPADKSALGFLTETRAAFRASGFTGVQVDPPQAISALLLQEAARRAPKPVRVDDRAAEPGWFARFVKSFVKHPAMAAAMMLVVVAGVGGLLYSHQGKGSFADQTTMAGSTAIADNVAAGSAAAQQAMLQAKAAALDSLAQQESYRVDLADNRRDGAAPTDAVMAAGSGSSVGYGTAAIGGVTVTTPSAMPKDLEEDSKIQDKEVQSAHVETPALKPAEHRRAELVSEEAAAKKQKITATATGAKDEDKSVDQATAPAVAPTAPGMIANAPMGSTGNGNGAPRTDTTQVAKPPAPPPKATVAKGNAPGDGGALLAWAKDQHARAVSLVRDNDCPSAAKIAAQIATRATDYYNANVVNDRALKACQAYFAEQREKDAERTNKARAAKKVDANEVEPAPAQLHSQ